MTFICDLGSDGVATYNAWEWVDKCNANYGVWADPAHGVHRNFALLFKRLGLGRLSYLFLVGVNLAFGPDEE